MRMSICLLLLCTHLSLGGEIVDMYSSQEGEKAYHSQTSSAKKEPLLITEIGLARSSGGRGAGALYEAIIDADGRVRWEGVKGVARQGKRTGRVNVGEFERLASFAQEIHLLDQPPTFYSGGRDAGSIYLYVRQGNRQKVIWCYEMNTPTPLWALAKLIDTTLEGAAWGDPERQTALQKKLRDCWIESFSCQDMTITEAFALLRQEAIDSDIEQAGVEFAFNPPLRDSGDKAERHVTLAFGPVPLLDAIEILTRACRLSYRVDDDSIAVIGSRQ